MRGFLVALFLGGSACAGSVCAPSCEKIYGSDTGQCAIQEPGMEGEEGQQDLISECVSMCSAAAAEPGDIGDYDPNARASPAEDVTLENRAQVEAWADCIASTSCENIDDGYCAPLR